MVQKFINKIKEILKKDGHPIPPGQNEEAPPKKALAKQVFEGKPRDSIPAFALGLDGALLQGTPLIEALKANTVCKFAPHFEFKRIYTTREKFDGDLETEYEGPAGGCGPLKNFGLQVAQADGYMQAYRYVDLNHLFAHCCDNPEKCVFYKCAKYQEDEINQKSKRI